MTLEELEIGDKQLRAMYKEMHQAQSLAKTLEGAIGKLEETRQKLLYEAGLRACPGSTFGHEHYYLLGSDVIYKSAEAALVQALKAALLKDPDAQRGWGPGPVSEEFARIIRGDVD